MLGFQTVVFDERMESRLLKIIALLNDTHHKTKVRTATAYSICIVSILYEPV